MNCSIYFQFCIYVSGHFIFDFESNLQLLIWRIAMYYPCNVRNAVEISDIYSLSTQHFAKDFSFDGESHDFWETVFVLDGKVGITADNDVYTLGSGQMVFHKPMEFHRIRSEDGTDPTVVIFSFSAADMPKLQKRVYTVTDENIDEVKAIFEIMTKVFYKCDGRLFVNSDREFDARLVLKRLELLLLTVILSDETEETREISRGAENYRRIVDTMRKNIGQTLSVDDIARLCNMSRSNVKRVFSKYSGMGVIEYFNAMKVKRAKKLLRDGMSIKEVATELGFDNQNYFSTMFKRIDGVSPGKYKE